MEGLPYVFLWRTLIWPSGCSYFLYCFINRIITTAILVTPDAIKYKNKISSKENSSGHFGGSLGLDQTPSSSSSLYFFDKAHLCLSRVYVVVIDIFNIFHIAIEVVFILPQFQQFLLIPSIRLTLKGYFLNPL